jgi:hypothetical protein
MVEGSAVSRRQAIVLMMRMALVVVVVVIVVMIMPVTVGVMMAVPVRMIVPVLVVMLVVVQALARPRAARVLAEHQRLDGDRHGVGRHADTTKIDIIEIP